MKCITCNGDTEVYETINSPQIQLNGIEITYRQRKCKVCKQKFFTKEIAVKDEECEALFREWTRERSRKNRAKKKGIVYDPVFADGRQTKKEPKMPTKSLF